MLVLTRPLDAHRLADRLRQEHGVGGRVVGAVGAIRSRSLDEHDTHLLGQEAEDARQGGSHPVGGLRRRPDRCGVAANVCDGTRRRKRRVTLTRPEVRRRHRRLCRRQRCLERGPGLIAVADWPRWSAVHNCLVALDDALAQIALQVVVPREPAPRGPFRLELARRPHRCPLVVRDHREEALDPDNANAGKLRDGGFVDRDERCTDGWRPDHAAVEHAGNAEVLDVLIATRALGRDLGPRRGLSNLHVLRRKDERCLRVHLQLEAPAADQVAYGYAATACSGARFARDDREVSGRAFQPRRRETEERLAGGRRSLTNGGASACQPRAAARAADVRAARRVSVDNGDPPGVHAELFGRHLRHRDAHAGPDVHFARVDRDRAVRVDREKAVDIFRIERPPVVSERTRRLSPARRMPARRRR